MILPYIFLMFAAQLGVQYYYVPQSPQLQQLPNLQMPEYIDFAYLPTGTERVLIQATGIGSRNTNWQQYDIGPLGNRVQLDGYQPFNVIIDRSDGTYVRFDGVNVCNWMAECRRNGKPLYDATYTIGAIGPDQNGTLTRLPGTKVSTKIRAMSDSVQIPYFTAPVPTTTYFRRR